jgi:DNA-binding transcriptional ArsR family regulator
MSKQTLTREQILEFILEGLGTSLYLLGILNKEGPLHKEQLKEATNEFYAAKNNGEKLIGSRHSLDVLTAKLEGAGVVTVTEVGRSRLFRLSKLGEEIINYSKGGN